MEQGFAAVCREQIPGSKVGRGRGEGGHSLPGIVTEQRAAEFNSNKLRPRILFGSKILFRQHLLASVRKAGPLSLPTPPFI